MKFFLDNCIGPPMARALRAIEEKRAEEIIHLQDRFPANTPDVDWIRALHAEGDWIIVSGDMRITRNKVERAAWEESGLTAFFFGDKWAGQGRWKLAHSLIGWWPEIRRLAETSEPGTGYMAQLKARDFKMIHGPKRA